MIDPEKLVQDVDELPPMMHVVMELVQATNDPDVPVQRLVELIDHDPALTANVLKLCNSAYYGLPGKIISVQKALVYIGINTLVNFVLAGYLSSFYQRSREIYRMNKGEIWRHSVGCAVASRCIANRDGKDPVNAAFTAGLIHDIGKIILYPKIGEELDNILMLVENESLTLHEAEDQVLGCTSIQVGKMLVELWQLPAPLIDAIVHHKTPDKAEHDPMLVAQVHMADIIAENMETGVQTNDVVSMFHPSALGASGLEIPMLDELIPEIRDQYDKAGELIALAQ